MTDNRKGLRDRADDRMLPDVYEKIGYLTGTVDGVKTDVDEIKTDVKAISENVNTMVGARRAEKFWARAFMAIAGILGGIAGKFS